MNRAVWRITIVLLVAWFVPYSLALMTFCSRLNHQRRRVTGNKPLWTSPILTNIHFILSLILFKRTGAIKKRAEDLHRMLSSTMEGMPVNFLAHSMVRSWRVGSFFSPSLFGSHSPEMMFQCLTYLTSLGGGFFFASRVDSTVGILSAISMAKTTTCSH